MTIGIILAGGAGTRLGPTLSSTSKSLISYKQKPQLIRQTYQLREAGADLVVVVASPHTVAPVKAALKIVDGEFVETTVATQKLPAGPVDAITNGIRQAQKIRPIDRYEDIVVIMSDTYVADDELIPMTHFIGIGEPTDLDRSWCYLDHTGNYVDGKMTEADYPEYGVTIGLYRLSLLQWEKGIDAAMDTKATADAEVGMAPLLDFVMKNSFTVHEHMFKTWVDIGDMMSLISSQGDEYNSRHHHNLYPTSYGTIIKSGVRKAESDHMKAIMESGTADEKALYPQIFSVMTDTYEIEILDTLSLAELWLYWPGRADTWKSIISRVLSRVKSVESDADSMISSQDFYHDKAVARLNEHARKTSWEFTDEFRETLLAAKEYLPQNDPFVYSHGDLNFTNIFYGMRTGTVKLIDPRGGSVPASYTHAKMFYSQWFAPITHDLGWVDEDDDLMLPFKFGDHAFTIFESVTDDYDIIELIAASAFLLLAAVPLHSLKQGDHLIKAGTQLVKYLVEEWKGNE